MKALPPLPVREDGVGPSVVGLIEGEWDTLLAFFAHRFPAVSEQSWRERMARREVVDPTGQPVNPDTPYRPGICIYYYREHAPEPLLPFEEIILHQDEHLLVVDKPHFLPVTPGGRYLHETLLVRLRRRLQLPQLVPVHRLDRETAGVMLFSCQPHSRDAYQSLFRERRVEKVYEALAPHLSELSFPLVRTSRIERSSAFFMMQEVPGEPNAITHIEILERRGALSLYRLQPITGKQHQLRLHMAALGAPICNDGFYPRPSPCTVEDHTKPLHLLAKTLRFVDPLSGMTREFHSQRTLDQKAQ